MGFTTFYPAYRDALRRMGRATRNPSVMSQTEKLTKKNSMYTLINKNRVKQTRKHKAHPQKRSCTHSAVILCLLDKVHC